MPVRKASVESSRSVFIAAGVGITPLLAQAPALLGANADFHVLWSLRGEDLGLAIDSFQRIEGLTAVTKLFVTGDDFDIELMRQVQNMGSAIELRRMCLDDGEPFKGSGQGFFVCTAPTLLRKVNCWLTGERVVWEDFGY